MAQRLIINDKSKVIHFDPGLKKTCNTKEINEMSSDLNDAEGVALQNWLLEGYRICKRCSP